MEVVARDLKALGLYQARALAYDGVEVDILVHELSQEQRRIYDSYAGAFKVIHANIEAALEATGIMQEGSTLNRNAKSAALSAFESAKQRFFGHLLTAMKCPSLIRAIEADLDAGRSAVIQLVSTGEALMERRLAEIPASEWDDLGIDLTPREAVLDFLAHAFPVQLQEPFTDSDGNLMSRPAVDAEGRPVLCQEALAQRDALIEKLASLPPVHSALDQIVHHFGHEAVAEVTGRSRRVLRISDGGGERLALRSRPASANLAETSAFMDGTKRILVFSMAGGTGRSYHSDLSSANTGRRVHYLLEPGWRADQAIQGLGRTHRTHQASAPQFRPVTTDVKGERRFIATIARRLDSLGAITRGQRDSQTAMGGSDATLFRESDNLESVYAKAALRRFYTALWRGDIADWSLERFEDATGLKLTWEGSLKEDLPPMPRFLNRLLALPIAEQNQLFSELEDRIASGIEQAMEAGTYEVGVETVRADSLSVAGRETLYTHPGSGAATELVEIVRRDRLEPTSADTALEIGAQTDLGPVLVFNDRSDRAAVVLPASSRMFDDGGVQERVRLLRPAGRDSMAREELDASNWRKATEAEWRRLWDTEIKGLPSHRESRFWLATGLLLPVWDRLPSENMRVRRLATDSGEALIGRVLDAGQVRAVRSVFGLAGGPAMTGAEAFEEVLATRHRARPRQRLAPRAPAHHGRRPGRDRGTHRFRHTGPQAHGLHGRDHLLAHARLRAGPRSSRTRHPALASRRLSPSRNPYRRRAGVRTADPPPAGPTHRREHCHDRTDRAHPARRPQLRVLPKLRAGRRAATDPHRLRRHAGLCAHRAHRRVGRERGGAVRPPERQARSFKGGLDRPRRKLHASRGTPERRPLPALNRKGPTRARQPARHPPHCLAPGATGAIVGDPPFRPSWPAGRRGRDREPFPAFRRAGPFPWSRRRAGPGRTPGRGEGGGLLHAARARQPAQEGTAMSGIDFDLEQALSGSDLLTEIGLHPGAIQDVIDDDSDRRCPDTWSERGT